MERFWAKVRKSDGCWDWAASLTKGYGQFWLDGKQVKAHRVAWFLEHGEWPPADKLVCHSCDNPKCVNPAHLFLGSALDNNRDMIKKARNRTAEPTKLSHPGENNPSARLTWPLVEEIRAKHRTGQYTNYALAAEYGVCQQSINNVVNFRTWQKR